MGKKRFAVLGSGFLGGIIVRAWRDGFLPDYELVGVAGRDPDKTAALARKAGCPACADLDALIALKPDIVAEAASVQAVRDGALSLLSHGISMVVLSIGAFADRDFYTQASRTAAVHGAKVHIASGAVGGFDVLRTVSLMGRAKAGIETRKGPDSLKNTPLFREELAQGEEQVFSGNAKEAIALLPTKVNVAVAASLATVGPENCSVAIRSVPGFVGDDHKITAEIEGVRAVVDVYSSTSAIAGWSVVAALRNLTSPIQF